MASKKISDYVEATTLLATHLFVLASEDVDNFKMTGQTLINQIVSVVESTSLANYYTIAQTDAILENYYNSTEIDTLIGNFVSVGDNVSVLVNDVGYITNSTGGGIIVDIDGFTTISQTTLQTIIQEIDTYLNPLTWDPSGFTNNLAPADDTLQEVFDKLDALDVDIPAGLTWDPSGFTNNLAPTDDTLQEVFDKVDALVASSVDKNRETVIFQVGPSNLNVMLNEYQHILVPSAKNLISLRLAVEVAPVGSAITVTATRNGTNMLTTATLDIADGSLTSALGSFVDGSPLAAAQDDAIVLTITQIGSTTPGKSLKAYLIWEDQ